MTGRIALRHEEEGALAVVTLSHPGRLNAMNRAMWRALRSVFEDTIASDTALRCVLVRGEGGAFCAGGDISEYPSFRFDEPTLRAFHEDEVWGALAAMLDCPVPVVAQIVKRTFSTLNRAAAPVGIAQHAINSIADMLASAYRYADSPEHREGIAAFIAKRNPSF